jgi:hypothetical protein
VLNLTFKPEAASQNSFSISNLLLPYSEIGDIAVFSSIFSVFSGLKIDPAEEMKFIDLIDKFLVKRNFKNTLIIQISLSIIELFEELLDIPAAQTMSNESGNLLSSLILKDTSALKFSISQLLIEKSRLSFG